MAGQDGEKTEQPTWRRLDEARRKGQVAKSQDLTSALLWLGALAALWLGGAVSGIRLARYMSDSLRDAALSQGELDAGAALSALTAGLAALAWTLAPLAALLFVLALLSSFLQVGPVFSFEAVKMNAGRLNPSENFRQRFLKSRPYIELSKTVLKIIIVSLIVWGSLSGTHNELLKLSGQDAAQVVSFAFSLCLRLSLMVGLVFLLIGGGDYFLQRFLHLKELRMSKQEVKQEAKENEGDPLIKGARHAQQQELLAENILAAVRGADVVLVNPTHVAVALKYDSDSMNAPTVVAKGAELMAAQMRSIAEAAKVPVVRDAPLARALFDVEVDAEVPEELHVAVAVVLDWVFKLARGRGEI